MYKTINFTCCFVWVRNLVSLTLREEHRVKVFENRVLRRILNLRGRKWQEAGQKCIMRSFITCALKQILSG
jgi:hypothetical protein